MKTLRHAGATRHIHYVLAALLLGSTVLTAGCGQPATVVPQSKADDTTARIQAIKDNPQLSDSQKTQQIQRLQAEVGLQPPQAGQQPAQAGDQQDTRH